MPAISSKRAAHIGQPLHGSRFRHGEEDIPALVEYSLIILVCEPASGSDLLQPILVMKATENRLGRHSISRGNLMSLYLQWHRQAVSGR